ncbi:F-box domain-containing protein [Favolaschia claudopus]|uniref:F-box domain-containing protein n=1 Tax=Favolaschia claudopus TaxID=2862362 RepID=A0AAW0CAR9_9AGAR
MPRILPLKWRKKNPIQYPEQITALPWLPQDILAEICLYLPPHELYNLSQVNRSIRAFLTSRSNAGFIWHRAMEDAVAEGTMPPLPPYLENHELAWARLVFSDYCSICFYTFTNPVPGMFVQWSFNSRMCSICIMSQIQKRLPRELKRHLKRQEWRELLPYIVFHTGDTPLYLSKEVTEFTREYLSLSTSQERADFLSRRRIRTAAVNRVSLLLIFSASCPLLFSLM